MECEQEVKMDSSNGTRWVMYCAPHEIRAVSDIFADLTRNPFEADLSARAYDICVRLTEARVIELARATVGETDRYRAFIYPETITIIPIRERPKLTVTQERLDIVRAVETEYRPDPKNPRGSLVAFLKKRFPEVNVNSQCTLLVGYRPEYGGISGLGIIATEGARLSYAVCVAGFEPWEFVVGERNFRSYPDGVTMVVPNQVPSEAGAEIISRIEQMVEETRMEDERLNEGLEALKKRVMDARRALEEAERVLSEAVQRLSVVRQRSKTLAAMLESARKL